MILHKSSSFSTMRGFTIVELLVVMVVIGVLAAITVVSYSGITKQAEKSAAAMTLSNMVKQIQMQYAVTGVFPTRNVLSPTSDDEINLGSVAEGSINLQASADGKVFILTLEKKGNMYYATNNSQPTEFTGLNSIGVEFTNATETIFSDYKILTFIEEDEGTFKVKVGEAVNFIEVLVVAGGGGGGSSRSAMAGGGGGGGAGGYLGSDSYLVMINQEITIKIGAGGQAGITSGIATTRGDNGDESKFGNIIALGGGGGGASATAGFADGAIGGSGCGAGFHGNLPHFGGLGNGIQGNKGGDFIVTTPRTTNGAGGGGAGGNGQSNNPVNGGAGGIGRISDITGVDVTYSKGGDGGSDSVAVSSGAVNTGKGGSGAYLDTKNAGNGGSGVVIVKYKFK